MTLYFFDYGRFENLGRIFDRKFHYRQRKFSIDNNNSSENQQNSETPKDEDLEDIISPISTVCQGHIMKNSNSDRRMSVPQLSRNKNVVRTRDQRITSVIGVPHRHHITIAVNDEPVDIIKTTCTGPCLQSCHANSAIQPKSLPTDGFRLHSNPYLNTNSRNSNQSANIILLTLIYVISTLSLRSIINLYIIMNDITVLQRKVTLSFMYFFAATITLTLSLNCFSKPTKSLTIRIEIILSIVLIIFWSGLHLLPISSWPLLIFTAFILGFGTSLLWDSHLRILTKWNFSVSCKLKDNYFNDFRSKSKIVPTTTIIGHSLNIWASILIFILLESFSPNISDKNLQILMPPENEDSYNGSVIRSNITGTCGINFRDIDTGRNLTIPNRIMYCLIYICIGLNVISLILVILLLDKSKALRMLHQSIDKDVTCPMIGANTNANVVLSQPTTVSESWINRMKNYFFMRIRNDAKILVKLWKCKTFKCVLPSLFTIGMVEGFFVTDYNQNFISCFKKPSFIGISTLTLAIGPIAFVNIFPLITKQKMIEIFSFPISRAIFLSSSLLLALTKVGSHWSYLLIFFPWVVALDNTICLTLFYISASSFSNNLLDSSVVIQRVLRMLGISVYTLISGVFGTFSAALVIVLAHFFISPVIMILGSLVRCSKN